MRRFLALLLVTAATTLGLTTTAAAATPGFSVSYTTIPGDGGTPLKGFLVRPTGRGPGPFPVLVMPSSWSVPDIEYVGAAAKLATASGYEVVSYTSRGFWDSAGTIEVAGPQDVADLSRVVDWALASTPADPARVGAAGISYGAGISLLAAAADKRIRAVVAMSAWADLAKSLYPNQTVSALAVEGLIDAGKLTGRPGPVLRQAEKDYRAGDFDAVLPIAPVRSAASKIDAVNANGAAIMIGNAWEDSIFPPSQVLDFYQRLTGPKRIMLAPGDHGTNDGPGAVGLPNDIWSAAGRWFDHYLGGAANGVDREQPVQLRPANGGAWHGYPSLSAGRQDSIGLGQAKIIAGVDTIAGSGIPLLSGALQGYLNLPTGVATPLVNRLNAGVWSGSTYSAGVTVQGTPQVHATVTTSAADTSLFAYLYDVNALGVGSLITHKPYTIRGAKPGSTTTLDFGLEPVQWNVPAGHHLTLVVDTVDPRYRSESTLGSTVTISGSLAIPLA
ncbi:CocE/NonD family hydrolase [Kutzneria albida]|uniref:Peptidase S15 n=1 Tax=Kutzneria albida DSM 43870 TaxID=1449976 RepID=W5W0G1_9PSEU|nr:CocE/NonD family hydrolase [Kutzneria albida]AHH94317.1 peptidase S15 [Kutzneria albida DSM 43870]